MQEVDTLDKNRSTKYVRLQSFTKQTKVSMLQCVTTKFRLALVCSKMFTIDAWVCKNREPMHEVDTLDKKQVNIIHKVCIIGPKGEC